MPFFVVLLALRPVCLAGPIVGHIVSLLLVNVMVVHAPLRKDVLTPGAILPVASIVGARRELGVAILQILGQDPCAGLRDDFKIAKETVLHVLAVFVVETMW